MRLPDTSSLALILGLLIAAPVAAQSGTGDKDGRVLSSAAMDAALADHESSATEARAELARVLSQPRVREMASERGIDMSQVESAAASLTDGQVEEVAPLVAKATAALQSGGSITISVAAVIIILLLLILLT